MNCHWPTLIMTPLVMAYAQTKFSSNFWTSDPYPFTFHITIVVTVHYSVVFRLQDLQLLCCGFRSPKLTADFTMAWISIVAQLLDHNFLICAIHNHRVKPMFAWERLAVSPCGSFGSSLDGKIISFKKYPHALTDFNLIPGIHWQPLGGALSVFIWELWIYSPFKAHSWHCYGSS